MVLNRLPNPIEKAREVKDNIEEKNHKKLFYENQFKEMVENGNYEKAVELIWDEARNLNVRIKNKIEPDNLAQYCYDRLYHSEKGLENREEGIEELQSEYSIEESEE